MSLSNPRRARLFDVLAALVCEPIELAMWPLDVKGMFIEHDRLVWYDVVHQDVGRAERVQLARWRAAGEDLATYVRAPVPTRPVRVLALKTMDPSEAWEILVTRGLIPASWVASGGPWIVDTKVCLSCTGARGADEGSPCFSCAGYGDRRTITRKPPDMASAVALAADTLSVAVGEELVREIEPLELGQMPIGWRCVERDELRRLRGELGSSAYRSVERPASALEERRIAHAQNELGALGALLGAPDSRTMTWTELAFPLVGQGLDEALAEPTPYVRNTPPSVCLSVLRPERSDWDDITPVGRGDRTPEDRRKGVMDHIRAWIKKMGGD